MPSSRVWNAVPPPPRKTRRLISAHHPPTLFFLLSASCTSRQRKGSYCVCCVGYNIDSGRFVLASVAHTSDRAASSHPSEVPPHQTDCHHLSHIAVAIIALALAVHVLNPILSLPTPAAPPPPQNTRWTSARSSPRRSRASTTFPTSARNIPRRSSRSGSRGTTRRTRTMA